MKYKVGDSYQCNIFGDNYTIIKIDNKTYSCKYDNGITIVYNETAMKKDKLLKYRQSPLWKKLEGIK